MTKLNDLQIKVTKENKTEPPYQNEYWDNFEDGIYVDIYNGKPLFSSLDKYDAKCGWPSFIKPINSEEIIEKADYSHMMIRTEIRTKSSNSHLGHVFTDGPKDKGGLRYCMNSAALKFIPYEKMDEMGYSEFKKIFVKSNNKA